jgi:hypothetical protein
MFKDLITGRQISLMLLKLQSYDVNEMNPISEEIYFTLPVNLTASTAKESYPHIFDWLDLAGYECSDNHHFNGLWLVVLQ